MEKSENKYTQYWEDESDLHEVGTLYLGEDLTLIIYISYMISVTANFEIDLRKEC